MIISLLEQASRQEVIRLFEEVFTQSEGETEGKIIRKLVTDLLSSHQQNAVIGFTATIQNTIVGCIIFSKLTLAENQCAYLLSPLAVASKHQQQGIGQALINDGLDQLRRLDIDLVITYGDPNFYTKTGFKQIDEKLIQPPFPLSQPEGWLGQSLSDNSLPILNGKIQCVEAFNDANYW